MYFIINIGGSAAYVRTLVGATCKSVLQLEVTFIDVKNMCLHYDSNPGLWNNVNFLTMKLRRTTSYFHQKEYTGQTVTLELFQCSTLTSQGTPISSVHLSHIQKVKICTLIDFFKKILVG